MSPTTSEEDTPHLDDDLCIDLLAGLLPNEDRERQLEHIRACPACEQLLRRNASERERLHSSAAKLAANKRTSVVPLSSARRSPLRTAGWTAGFALAAAITALIVLPHRAKMDLGLRPMPAFTELTRMRAEGSASIEAKLAEGLNAYSEARYEQAIPFLRDAAEASARFEMMRRVYLGNALAMTGDHTEAVATLESLPFAVLPDPWAGEAAWTLALSYMESGRMASADSLLALLADQPGAIGLRASVLRASDELD